jgi:hypothetical protein
MNVTGARSEMSACVDALRERLQSECRPARRTALMDAARREIRRIRKRFKRSIDEMARRRVGFSVNAREGIERKLTEVTAEALKQVDRVAHDAAAGDDAPDGPSSQP